ncbi:MAG: phenylacetic acid degradation protein PaaD [Candidatus Tectimicrobiota bacterium]|nr:MAG: phenylacetic acid degradation protein PaaD [Candidatus Tectomicrobia bacterium]
MQPVPDALRQRLQSDPWAQSLGIEYLDIRPGYCRLALQLQPHMINFYGTPHGGVIFTLADAAFAVACNAHGVPALALNVTISYLATVAPQARLIAEARQRQQGRRTGLYEVSVYDETGTLVALAHCTAYRVGHRSPPVPASEVASCLPQRPSL